MNTLGENTRCENRKSTVFYNNYGIEAEHYELNPRIRAHIAIGMQYGDIAWFDQMYRTGLIRFQLWDLIDIHIPPCSVDIMRYLLDDGYIKPGPNMDRWLNWMIVSGQADLKCIEYLVENKYYDTVQYRIDYLWLSAITAFGDRSDILEIFARNGYVGDGTNPSICEKALNCGKMNCLRIAMQHGYVGFRPHPSRVPPPPE